MMCCAFLSSMRLISTYGAAISNPADLQLGEIVFFVNTYRRGISHVGVYVGAVTSVQALTPDVVCAWQTSIRNTGPIAITAHPPSQLILLASKC
jgi:cell wall-associated NlpC family hydrolase